MISPAGKRRPTASLRSEIAGIAFQVVGSRCECIRRYYALPVDMATYDGEWSGKAPGELVQLVLHVFWFASIKLRLCILLPAKTCKPNLSRRRMARKASIGSPG